MRRHSRVLLSLLVCLLVLSGLPLGLVRAEEQLSRDIPYNYSPNSSYPGPDYLPGFIGVDRAELTADAKLQVSLESQDDGSFSVAATIIAGEHSVQLNGTGSFGLYESGPLHSGEFLCQTDKGVEGKLYLTTYPARGERKAVFLFGENTPQAVTVAFGKQHGNIEAISLQIGDLKRAEVKLPLGYLLDGQPLVLEPAPLIQDNQVLVPVRPLLAALGARVAWDAASQSIRANLGDASFTLSLANQTLQVNGGAAEPLLVTRQPNGQVFGSLSALARACGATILTRRDGTVALISRERTRQEQGRLQFIFANAQNLIIQNDTDRPQNFGGWSLVCNDPTLEVGPMIDFRFPAEFVLQPGEQVQVSGELDTEPDNHQLFDWNMFSGSPPEVRPTVQLLINSLSPADEGIMLMNQGSDLYLGNWRLVSLTGKPAFDLPDIWLGQNQMVSVRGEPGTPQNEAELRWPNLASVEQAYLVEQAELARLKAEQHAKLVEIYAPLTAALQLTDSGYHFYSELEADGLLLKGEIAPYEGKPQISRSLQQMKMNLFWGLGQIGDRIPVYYISPDGRDVYLGMIKQDGSQIAYRLTQAIDQGFYTWICEQVLPE